ncbi:hypothetical protein O9G_002915 [Rozella allomycis CSF55]|uniref:Uncharacterized protein n=1 Tax=Rozella allomycis (strain CSF55) TaxID=988480 RepID=A0A075B1J6_ROZAC|nr:hypothetical protein O9G_002915 [Rozella allomycis CSF55]|eukprot:EPZ36413.1 hypothetical protein O9G_002915 [Rozella allomycis CSF55]
MHSYVILQCTCRNIQSENFLVILTELQLYFLNQVDGSLEFEYKPSFKAQHIYTSMNHFVLYNGEKIWLLSIPQFVTTLTKSLELISYFPFLVAIDNNGKCRCFHDSTGWTLIDESFDSKLILPNASGIWHKDRYYPD